MPEKSVAVPITSTQTTPAQTSLKLVEPQKLLDRMNRFYDAVARRAFEIFEHDGRFFGRDWEHWFRAEAELLHPVHVSISESGDALLVDAEVPGFAPNELQVSLEPWRLTISGKREFSAEQKKATTVYKEQCSSEIFRVIDLPVQVDASKTTATLKNGILQLNMGKVAQANRTRVQVHAA
jgi:HSP20 family protein